MNRSKLFFLSLASVGAITLAACAPRQESTSVDIAPPVMLETETSDAGEMRPEANIVETAQAAGSFTTLLAAAEAAGLVDALSTSTITLLAPTDAAFAKLPAGTVEALLEDPETLAEILTYHVIAGEVPAADVVNLTTASSLQGESISISAVGGTVKLNNSATVVQTDIMASNGIIHVIDTVIMPPSMQ